MMKIIKLDASHWKCSHDFYDAILPALGAPDWHGRNVNALVESLVWGEINAVEPPYKIEVMSTQNLSDDVAEEVRWTVEGVRAARKDYQRRRGTDVDVDFKIAG